MLIRKNLLRESDIALGAFGADVVQKNRFAVAGSFGQPDASRDYGFEDLVAKELLEVIGYLAGQVGPVIVHREKHAFHPKRVAEAIPDAIHRVEQLRDAFQRKELALDRDEDGIGRNERVQRQQVERRGTIDDDVVIPLAEGFELLSETELALILVDEFDVCSHQISVAGHDIQAFAAGRAEDLFQRAFSEETIVQARRAVLENSQPGGGISLRIGINQQDSEVIRRQRRR